MSPSTTTSSSSQSQGPTTPLISTDTPSSQLRSSRLRSTPSSRLRRPRSLSVPQGFFSPIRSSQSSTTRDSLLPDTMIPDTLPEDEQRQEEEKENTSPSTPMNTPTQIRQPSTPTSRQISTTSFSSCGAPRRPRGALTDLTALVIPSLPPHGRLFSTTSRLGRRNRPRDSNDSTGYTGDSDHSESRESTDHYTFDHGSPKRRKPTVLALPMRPFPASAPSAPRATSAENSDEPLKSPLARSKFCECGECTSGKIEECTKQLSVVSLNA